MNPSEFKGQLWPVWFLVLVVDEGIAFRFTRMLPHLIEDVPQLVRTQKVAHLGETLPLVCYARGDFPGLIPTRRFLFQLGRWVNGVASAGVQHEVMPRLFERCKALRCPWAKR